MNHLLLFIGVVLLGGVALSCSSSTVVRPSYARTHPQKTAVTKQTTSTKSHTSSKKSPSKKKKEPQSLSSSQTTQVSSSLTQKMIEKKAKPYLGVRYRWGGTTKKGFDCSGFVWRLYQDLGYTSFRRTSSSQMYLEGRSVTSKHIKPGDLVFFNTSGGGVSHVGMMINSTTFVHASTSKGVMYSKLSNSYWSRKIVGFRRYY